MYCICRYTSQFNVSYWNIGKKLPFIFDLLIKFIEKTNIETKAFFKLNHIFFIYVNIEPPNQIRARRGRNQH